MLLKKSMRFDLKSALLRALVLCICLPMVPETVHGWGVLAPATTHQYILREAYQLLQADPAFRADRFPRLDEILAHEGVHWGNVEYTGKGLGLLPNVSLIDGPGPDAKGNSPFSWHYYNPATGEGGAPEAVRRHYHYLAEGMLTGKKEALPKAASWSAHFLADMHCPYHVNGATLETAKKIKQEQLQRHQGAQHEGAVYLSDEIKGSVKFSYLSPIKMLSNDFRTEIDRFLEIGVDWFDPWYYNGDMGLATETSSHIAWETTINPGPYHLTGYEESWKNGSRSFDKPAEIQGNAATQLAKSAAALTRSKLDYAFDEPQPMINHAVRAVYTMWRASFSALDPKIEAREKDGFILAAGKITNLGNDQMDQVEVRLTPFGCSLLSEAPVRQLGNLPAGGSTTTKDWKLKPEGAACQLKMEVIASSPNPDLQYALAKTEISASKQAARVELPGTDTPAGAEGFMIIMSAELDVKYFDPKLSAPTNKRPGINFMTDVFRGTKLTWEGVKFTFNGKAHLDSSHRTSFPYIGSFPMPFSSDWAPGDYIVTAAGSIDPTGTLLRDITIQLQWKGKPVSPNYCWDLPEKFDQFKYTYTLKGIPLTGKGPIYQNGGKESGLLLYAYELSGEALKGKLKTLSHSQRWCLHPGESYDVMAISPAAAANILNFRISFVKRK